MIKKPQWLYNLFFGLKSQIKNQERGPIFIIGTGRSGTHFLCSCLNEFEELDDYFSGKESPYMFHEISALTVSQKEIPPYVIGYYKHMQRKVSPKIFLDQTHPNIWNVETLIKEFPNSKFVAISRDVYSVAYSMKLHEGVSKWIKNHMNYPKPNKFLGINIQNENLYINELTDLQRSVFRWCAHNRRLDDLAGKFPEFVIKVNYQDLHNDMWGEMRRLSKFLQVKEPVSVKEFNASSLHKKDSFTNQEIAEINSALDLYARFGD